MKGIKVIVILTTLFFLSCGSPNSPTPDPSGPPEIPFAFGLYDDFEGGKDQTRWNYIFGYFGNEKKRVNIIEEESGNSVLEIQGNSLSMLYPQSLYPHEFDKMSARVMLFEASESRDCYVYLRYNVRIASQGGGTWEVQIGIAYDPENRIHLFGKWQNYNTDEIFFRNLGNAEFEKWYKLEIRLIKIASNGLKIEFTVNDNVLSESIPTDSTILMDPSQLDISLAWRSIMVFGGFSGTFGKAWFDDVYAVSGFKPRASVNFESLMESPSILDFIKNPAKIFSENQKLSKTRNEEKRKEKTK